MSRYFLFLLLLLPFAALADEAAKAAPALSGDGPGMAQLIQMILGLLVVLGGILGLAWFMRRMPGMQGRSLGGLRVLAGLPVGTRERIVLVQVGETQLLLGVAPGRVQTLHVLDRPVEDIPAASTTAGFEHPFAQRFKAALERNHGQRRGDK